jgi:hypothetical protein
MATERVWLVDRNYNDKGMVTLVYATPDGERFLQKNLSEQMVMRTDVTAGKEVDEERLEPTHDEDRERYAAEATRMAEQHDPDETV